MNFAQVVSQLASLIGPTIEVVKAVESAVPAGTKGADKLAIVKDTLTKADAVVNAAAPVVASLWPVLESIIAAAVAAFNASGIFRRSKPVA